MASLSVIEKMETYDDYKKKPVFPQDNQYVRENFTIAEK